MCKSSAKILIQRYLQCFCRGLCHCHRHPQDRIGTQISLVLCSVHAAEFRIYFPLFQWNNVPRFLSFLVDSNNYFFGAIFNLADAYISVAVVYLLLFQYKFLSK